MIVTIFVIVFLLLSQYTIEGVVMVSSFHTNTLCSVNQTILVLCKTCIKALSSPVNPIIMSLLIMRHSTDSPNKADDLSNPYTLVDNPLPASRLVEEHLFGADNIFKRLLHEVGIVHGCCKREGIFFFLVPTLVKYWDTLIEQSITLIKYTD